MYALPTLASVVGASERVAGLSAGSSGAENSPHVVAADRSAGESKAAAPVAEKSWSDDVAVVGPVSLPLAQCFTLSLGPSLNFREGHFNPRAALCRAARTSNRKRRPGGPGRREVARRRNEYGIRSGDNNMDTRFGDTAGTQDLQERTDERRCLRAREQLAVAKRLVLPVDLTQTQKRLGLVLPSAQLRHLLGSHRLLGSFEKVLDGLAHDPRSGDAPLLGEPIKLGEALLRKLEGGDAVCRVAL